MLIKAVTIENNKRTSLMLPRNNKFCQIYSSKKFNGKPSFIYKIDDDISFGNLFERIKEKIDSDLYAWKDRFPNRNKFEIWECEAKYNVITKPNRMLYLTDLLDYEEKYKLEDIFQCLFGNYNLYERINSSNENAIDINNNIHYSNVYIANYGIKLKRLICKDKI